MRVALACPYAWDDPGGVQVHVRELANRLLDDGHVVTVLAPVRRSAAEPWVHAIGRPVDVAFNASNAPIDPRPWSLAPVRAVLEGFRADVVHVHEPFTPSTGMWATLAARSPVVATFHSGVERSRAYDVAAPFLRRVARRISVRIAVSRVAERVAAARVGGGFEVVPNGVDVERFRNAEPADLGPGPKLLFVGRLDERKGFPIAVAAFAELAAGRPDLRMVVVGDGPQRGALTSLAPSVRDRVTLLGAIANVDLAPYEVACDVYVGTAVGGESFGVVLVEAMAAGLPIVASDIAGYDEVLRDGVEGTMVPPRDPRAVARAVAKILDDPGLAARMSTAARERAGAFDWGSVTVRIEELYARAIARGPLR